MSFVKPCERFSSPQVFHHEGSEGTMGHNELRDQRKGGRRTVETRRRRRMQPTLLALEDRRLLSTFTVTSTLDNGSAGTLRWAVGQANSAGGAETIAFDKTVFKTPQTITLRALSSS